MERAILPLREENSFLSTVCSIFKEGAFFHASFIQGKNTMIMKGVLAIYL